MERQKVYILVKIFIQLDAEVKFTYCFAGSKLFNLKFYIMIVFKTYNLQAKVGVKCSWLTPSILQYF